MDTTETIKDAMEMMETIKNAQKFVESRLIDHLSEETMMVRVACIRGIILRSLRNNGATEEDIDWEKVNDILLCNINQYDFNIIDPVKSLADLNDIQDRINSASLLPGLPWRRCKCKDCKKLFYMGIQEVEFYEKKKLDTPKRCPSCRKARKYKDEKEALNKRFGLASIENEKGDTL